MVDFNYTIHILNRVIEDIKYSFIHMPVISRQRINELEKVKRILTEGTGYLGKSETVDGSKIIFFNEMN